MKFETIKKYTKNKCLVKFHKRKLYLYLSVKDNNLDNTIYWNEINYWKRDKIDLNKEKEKFAMDVIIGSLNASMIIKETKENK